MRLIANTFYTILIILTSCNSPNQGIISVEIDVKKEKGTIRPINGGNLGLLCLLRMLDLNEEFAELLETPKRIVLEYDQEDGLVFCAGTNEEHTAITILVSNFNKDNKTLGLNLNHCDFKGPVKYELYVIDESNNLTKVKEIPMKEKEILQINEYMTGPSVFLIKLLSSG